MNNSNPKMTLEEMRRTSIRTLMKLDMEILKGFLNQAEKALVQAEKEKTKKEILSAKLTMSWLEGAINFKLRKEGQRRDRRS